jgi:ATP-dependent exoDNAse (exonuclease V) alpha subunit
LREEQSFDAVDVLDPFHDQHLTLTEGWLAFDKCHAAEAFQVLCSVRKHAYGVFELNRWIQGRFRAKQLQASRQPWGLSLGDEAIVWGDKVILTRNGKREGLWNSKRKKIEEYLANGEIGIAGQGQGTAKNKLLNVEFIGRPDLLFGFWPSSFGPEGAPLELAYAFPTARATLFSGSISAAWIEPTTARDGNGNDNGTRRTALLRIAISLRRPSHRFGT